MEPKLSDCRICRS